MLLRGPRPANFEIHFSGITSRKSTSSADLLHHQSHDGMGWNIGVLARPSSQGKDVVDCVRHRTRILGRMRHLYQGGRAKDGNAGDPRCLVHEYILQKIQIREYFPTELSEYFRLGLCHESLDVMSYLGLGVLKASSWMPSRLLYIYYRKRSTISSILGKGRFFKLELYFIVAVSDFKFARFSKHL